jgi:hypothetical protein
MHDIEQQRYGRKRDGALVWGLVWAALLACGADERDGDTLAAAGAAGGTMVAAADGEPADVLVSPGDCRFEYLGEWVRCENAGFPNVVETDAPDLMSCIQQCLTRDDCTAVTDYHYLDAPDLGCYLYVSTCDAPAFAESWGEEDGGRDYRRACSTAQ